MKALTIIFIVLIALLQYPLWLGKGSWLRVWQVNQQVQKQRVDNSASQQRNDALRAEVRDLKQGDDAVEERARNELGMIKHDEVFYQVIDSSRFNPPVAQPDSPAETEPPQSVIDQSLSNR